MKELSDYTPKQISLGNKRLLKLASLHEKKRGKIDMLSFAYNCKTPACSAGLAAAKRIGGLKLADTEIGSAFPVSKSGTTGADAIYEVFALDWNAWYFLFATYLKRTHSQQAKALRAYVAKRSPRKS